MKLLHLAISQNMKKEKSVVKKPGNLNKSFENNTITSNQTFFQSPRTFSLNQNSVKTKSRISGV